MIIPIFISQENDEVAVKDNRTNSSFQRMPVKELFFKVDKPVIGAFRFNEHTLALFYGNPKDQLEVMLYFVN